MGWEGEAPTAGTGGWEGEAPQPVKATGKQLPPPGIIDWLSRVLPGRVKAQLAPILGGAWAGTYDPIKSITGLPEKALEVSSGLLNKGVQALKPDVNLTPQGQKNIEAAQPIINAITDPVATAAKIPRAAYEYSPDIAAMLLPGPKSLRGIGGMAEKAGMERTAGAARTAANIISAPVDAATALKAKIGRYAEQAEARTTPLAEIDNQIAQKVKYGLEKGVRPSVQGQRTTATRERYFDNGETAVQEIIKDKNNLKLADKEGLEVQGKLPESLADMSSSIAQEKTGFFQDFDRMQQAAGSRGAKVSTQSAIKELQAIVEGVHLPEVSAYAQKRIEWLQSHGDMTTSQAQGLLAELNQKTKAFHSNPTFETATSAGIDELIANHLRKAQDKAVSDAVGEGYQAARNKYGSMKAIEDDVNRRLTVDARKNIKGLIDFSDIFTGGEFISGVLSMNPITMASAVGRKGIANYYKKINSPDVIIKNMFSETEKLMQKKENTAAYQEATKGRRVPERQKALPPSSAPIERAISEEPSPVTRKKLSITERSYTGGQAAKEGSYMTEEELKRSGLKKRGRSVEPTE